MKTKRFYDFLFLLNLAAIYTLTAIFYWEQNLLALALAAMLIMVVAVPLHAALLNFEIPAKKKNLK